MLRTLANSLFLPSWTAFMVGCGVTAVAVSGDAEVFRRMQLTWAHGLATFWGVDIAVFGGEGLDPHGTYVIVSNHQSYVDIVVLFLALPVVPGFVAKRELSRVPFLASALRNGGHVLIDRNSQQSARASIRDAAAQVQEGRSVLIFPEGTRSDRGEVREFKSGGFHLAKAAGVPIVPVGIRGSGAILPRGGRLLQPGRVEVHIGEPIAAAEVERFKVRELVKRARAQVIELSAMPPSECVPGEPRPA